MRFCMRLSFFLFFLMLATLAKCQVVVSDVDKIVNIAYTTEYIEDPKGEVKIGDLIQQKSAFTFKKIDKPIIGFGLTPSTFWIKSTIKNQTGERLFIKIGNNELTDIQLFETNGPVVERQFNAGNWLPFAKREVKNTNYLFPLNIQKGFLATVYLRVFHTRGTQFPLQAGTLKSFYVVDVKHTFINGIYYGLMLLMMLYNLFVYFSFKDTSYLYYEAYVLLITLLNASLDGYAFEYLWPSLPVINPYADIIAAFVAISGILFVTHFLNTKENAPLFHQGLLGLLAAFLVNIVLIATGNFLVGSSIMETLSLLSVACIFSAACSALRKGFKPAKFFLIAWSLLLACITVFILKDFNILPYNDLTANALQIGSAAEALLLSIALADRINLYRKEKALAQRELIQSLQEKTTMQHDMLELEAKALRSQMNPHFIFNCMNSIKALIQQKDEDKAVSYLTTFSKLLRTILQNLDKREISLFDEIETCRLYTQLESMRFGNKFSYSFRVEPTLDIKSIQVPALILQPFIENAIWHGLMPKDKEGYISVKVEKIDDAIVCVVDDNGIGRELSTKNKFKHQASTHQSNGVKLTQFRLDLDNSLNNRNASVSTIDKKDKYGQPGGTTVTLSFREG
jgi:hypothetical protein